MNGRKRLDLYTQNEFLPKPGSHKYRAANKSTSPKSGPQKQAVSKGKRQAEVSTEGDG